MLCVRGGRQNQPADRRSEEEDQQSLTSSSFSSAHHTPLLRPVAPIGGSRWFTRGWTLQELLAPSLVRFYDSDWTLVGDRTALLHDISPATGFSSDVLLGHVPLHQVGIATRMSWASKRNTTRLEDEAYCLLGLFDINMPLLYDEGSKAFNRLQEEILKVSSDQTIFAWNGPERQLLAPSPANFADSATLVPRGRPSPGHRHEMITRGCHISLRFVGVLADYRTNPAILDCVDLKAPTAHVCICLSLVGKVEHGDVQVLEPDSHILKYTVAEALYASHPSRYNRSMKEKVLLLRSVQGRAAASSTIVKLAMAGGLEGGPMRLFPNDGWDQETKCTNVRVDTESDHQAILGESKLIWLGPSTERMVLKQRRLVPFVKTSSGFIIAFSIVRSRHSEEKYITIACRRCNYDDAPDEVENLSAKLVDYIYYRRRREWHVDRGCSAKYVFERHFDQQRLEPDQTVHFRWRGITISFIGEPIGMVRDGVMVVVHCQESVKANMRRAEDSLKERGHWAHGGSPSSSSSSSTDRRSTWKRCCGCCEAS